MCAVKLLDAGFALQLQQYVDEIVDGHPLWTSRFLAENSAAIVSVHRDFIRGGSQIIRTNSYQATVDGFMKHMGQTKESALDLIGKSVDLAKEAIAKEGKVGKLEVAGSVGPYGASLHDGSEYTGSYENEVTIDHLITWHKDRVRQLVTSGVDLLAFETLPCTKEAIALIRLLKQFPNTKAWISFSIKDEYHISNGEKFVDAITLILQEAEDVDCLDQLVAVGVNCLDPKLVFSLISEAKAKFPKQPFIVYPNSGEQYNTQLQRWEGVAGMKPVSEYVKNWLDLGVYYVGGCCRTTDKDLPAMWDVVSKWNANTSSQQVPLLQ